VTEQNISKLNMLRKIFRVNMVIGLGIAMLATYFMITGTYENIQARESAESTLGLIGVGGILYLIGFWYMCVFKHHIFFRNETAVK
jgi:uncharacterized membrane protein